MVRAVKTETTLVGNYINMSEGVIVGLSGTLTPYLTIDSQPSNEKIAAHTPDGVANSVVFSVHEGGSDTAGNQQINYQWYRNGRVIGRPAFMAQGQRPFDFRCSIFGCEFTMLLSVTASPFQMLGGFDTEFECFIDCR